MRPDLLRSAVVMGASCAVVLMAALLRLVILALVIVGLVMAARWGTELYQERSATAPLLSEAAP